MEFIWKKLKFMCVLWLFIKLIKKISIKVIQRPETNVKEVSCHHIKSKSITYYIYIFIDHLYKHTFSLR